MWEICFMFDGKRHCIPVPMLIEEFHVPGPEPVNFPELEVATSVLQLVKTALPSGTKSALSSQLSEVTNSFIRDVQNRRSLVRDLFEGMINACAGNGDQRVSDGPRQDYRELASQPFS